MRNRFGIISALLLSSTLSAAANEPADTLQLKETLQEVVVTGTSARRRIENPRIGAERLELLKLAQMPSFGGENDLIKSLALLPGVRSEGDGGGGFEVRGGNSSQNRVTLDGITLHNPAHVMGIFSTFNDNAIGSATLFKGPIPPQFGEASSAVLETTLAPGDMNAYHGALTVGILAAKVRAEGPIVKDKLSFAVDARRSYVDAFLKIVPKYRSTIMNFYDVSAKLRYTPDTRNLIDGSFFVSHDNMAISDLMGMYWGNIGGSLNWQARTDGDLTFTTTAAVTHYAPKMTISMMDLEQTMWTYIRNYSVNEKIRWQPTEAHGLEIGLRSELTQVKSAEWLINSTKEHEIRSLCENSLWADYSGNFANLFELTAGVRLNVSSVLSADRFNSYYSLLQSPAQFRAATYAGVEPRANMKYNINKCHNIKAGAGISSQNLHAIRGSSTSLPFDRFALTSAVVKPERSLLYALDYCGMTQSGSYDWSVEGYYRDIRNVYDLKDGKSVFSDINLESMISGGRGRSYGVEFMIRKNTGAVTGWISYTLSRTQTRIAEINDGRWYDATNDRRHDLSVACIWSINRQWSVSGSWIFLSGRPLTAPDVKYEVAGETCYYYSQRNGYMTPPTHRLDLSAKYIHAGRRFTYEWSFGIYNAYCRYNPYIVYFTDDPEKPSGTKAMVQAMYGLVPSVSYTLKF